MKFKKINLTKDETYKVSVDDKCLVVKCGKNRVWISRAMAGWIAEWVAKNYGKRKLVI